MFKILWNASKVFEKISHRASMPCSLARATSMVQSYARVRALWPWLANPIANCTQEEIHKGIHHP